MPMLSIYFFVSSIIKTIECAPKLGHVLFDPLLHEAELAKSSKEIPDDQGWLRAHLRMPTTLEVTSKKPCGGYDFDETLCKTVNDRVICGYNKNIGDVTDKIVDLANGCRIRGERLECGYLEGPFNLPRRPPANDNEYDAGDVTSPRPKLRYQPTRTSKLTYSSLLKKIVHSVEKDENNSKDITTKTTSLDVTRNGLENTTKVTVPLSVSTNGLGSTTKSIVSNINITLTGSSTTLKSKSACNSTAISTTNSSILTTTLQKHSSLKAKTQPNDRISKRYCVEKNDRIFCYSVKHSH